MLLIGEKIGLGGRLIIVSKLYKSVLLCKMPYMGSEILI
jgi:hypothetical protein